LEARFKTLNESTIRYWKKELANDPDIIRETEIHKKTQVRESKALYPEEEKKILDEVIIRRQKGLAIKGNDLRSIARKYIEDPSFRCSNGWLRNFLKRHRLSYRVCTHAIQKLLDNYPTLISKLLEQIRSLRFK
jgi:hypothetical protein